jgi:hypothetical protein
MSFDRVGTLRYDLEASTTPRRYTFDGESLSVATSGSIKSESLGSTSKLRSIPQRYSCDIVSLPEVTQGSIKSDLIEPHVAAGSDATS